MTHFDLYLQKGPVNGDAVAGLDELRRIVLLDGIPSNNDGMVRHVDAISRLRSADVWSSRNCASTSGSSFSTLRLSGQKHIWI